MDITIKKLTPELAEDYACFFDTTPHATGKKEHRCYCIWWSSAGVDGERIETVQERRELAKRHIGCDYIQGYLAYCDGKVVGWCNANTKADCYESFLWRMSMKDVDKEPENVKVKSVFCFTVAPEMRGKGVAGALLKRVCEDAEKDGFDFVEAYPNKAFINTELDFMGPVEMFEKLGFKKMYEVNTSENNDPNNQKVVMRKKLK